MTKPDTDETWERIKAKVATKPDGLGREAAWLSSRLGVSIQRVQNWKTRGVPASMLVDIASALGWSVNQVLGLAEPPAAWPFETIEPERFERLTPRQAAMVEIAVLQELDRIAASGKRDGAAA